VCAFGDLRRSPAVLFTKKYLVADDVTSRLDSKSAAADARAVYLSVAAGARCHGRHVTA